MNFEELGAAREPVITNVPMIDKYIANATSLGIQFIDNHLKNDFFASTDFGNVSNVIPSIHPVFKIKADYATFQVPLADTSDIQLATGTRASAEKPHQDSIFVNLQPHGQLTLTPKKGNEGKLNGTHSILGDLELDLDFSYLIEFHPESTIFDNWDHDF